MSIGAKGRDYMQSSEPKSQELGEDGFKRGKLEMLRVHGRKLWLGGTWVAGFPK